MDTDWDHRATPEQLARQAAVAMRIYEMAVDRFNNLVDVIIDEAAEGNTSVRRIVDIVTETAINCDYWDPLLADRHAQAIRNYPNE